MMKSRHCLRVCLVGVTVRLPPNLPQAVFRRDRRSIYKYTDLCKIKVNILHYVLRTMTQQKLQI